MNGRTLGLVLLFFMPQLVLAQDNSAQRTWRDAEGKYSVEAVLLDKTDTTVRLKKADGNVVTVPIARLSKEDRDFLDNLKKTDDNPFAGGSPLPSAAKPAPTAPAAPSPASPAPAPNLDPNTPPVLAEPTTPQALPSEGTTVLLSQSTPTAPLAADPAVDIPQLKPGSVLVASTDAYDKVVGPIMLHGPSGLCGVSVGRNVAGRPEETRGQIYLGTLPRGPFRVAYEGKEHLRLLDHDAASGKSLVLSNIDNLDRGGEFVILTGLAEGQPREVARYLLPGHDKVGFKPGVALARLIGGERLFALIDDVVYCWDLKSKSLVYRTESQSGRLEPTFSGSRKYVTLTGAKGFHLLDTLAGEDLGFVATGTTLAPGAAFHPDGQRLAFCSSNQWGVWDLARNEMLASGTVPDHLGGRVLGWVSDDWFLTDTGYVVDSQSHMVVWSYYAGPVESQRQFGGMMAITSKLNGLKIDCLPTPDAKALAAAKQLDTPAASARLMLTAPGTKVRLRVYTMEQVDQEAILAGLQEAVERAGWVVDPQAKLEVVASIGRGEAKELEFSRRAIGTPLNRATIEKVTITPFTSELVIGDGRQILWSRKTENRVPPLIFLRDGQTLEEAVKAYERPQPEFFAGLQIPPRIPKKEYAGGLGRSRLDKGAWIDFPR